MSIAESKLDEGILRLSLVGKVDSGNAAQAEQELNALRAEHPEAAVVLDFDKLQYISSAGLRVILRLRKERPELKIVNVSSEVYEVLDMTGFTEMLPVEKAYRRLSVEGCEVIGRGANGEVYRLDPDTIIKVYLNPDSLPDIQRERELARRAFVLGVPTAIPYDVVRVGEGYGSVFELLNAKSLAKLIAAEPEKLDEYVKISVDLLKPIHGTELKPGEIPDMKAVALGWAQWLKDWLPADQSDKLIRFIQAVPEDNHMLHGDYHIKNVMMQNGEALLIDMDTLCMGHPVFEFASIYLAYQGFSEVDYGEIQRFLGIPFETGAAIWDKTLRLYFGTDDQAVLDAFADKARLIGYARLLRRTLRRERDTEKGQAVIENCRKQIAALLDRIDVDNVTF